MVLVIDGHWFRCIGRIEPSRGKDYGIIGHNTMRAGLNAKTTHSAFLPQNFVTSDEKRILRIPGSASFLASYPTEPVLLSRMFKLLILSVSPVPDRNPLVCHSGSLESWMLFT